MKRGMIIAIFIIIMLLIIVASFVIYNGENQKESVEDINNDSKSQEKDINKTFYLPHLGERDFNKFYPLEGDYDKDYYEISFIYKLQSEDENLQLKELKNSCKETCNKFNMTESSRVMLPNPIVEESLITIKENGKIISLNKNERIFSCLCY